MQLLGKVLWLETYDEGFLFFLFYQVGVLIELGDGRLLFYPLLFAFPQDHPQNQVHPVAFPNVSKHEQVSIAGK